MIFRFDEFAVDTGGRRLLRNGREIQVSPKALLLLELLISKRPNAVSKQTIQDVIWPSTHVVEANVANLIGEIRTVLGDGRLHSQFIRTVPRFGYAFIGVGDTSEARTENAHDANPLARSAHSHASFYWSTSETKNLGTSLRYYQAALECDPEYAPAHSGMSRWYVSAALNRALPPGEALTKAQDAAERALKIDPALASAHLAVAAISLFQYQWTTVQSELQQALRIDPNLVEAHIRMSQLASFIGDPVHSEEHCLIAQELDPMSPWVQLNSIVTFYALHKFDHAVRAAERALQLTPDSPKVLYWLGLSWHFLGDSDRASQFLEQSHEFGPDHPASLVGIAYVSAQRGQRQRALAIADDLTAGATRAEVSPWDFAELHTGLGENRLALDYLDRSFALRLPELAGVRSDPLFDPLHREPRFRALLARMNLPTLEQ